MKTKIMFLVLVFSLSGFQNVSSQIVEEGNVVIDVYYGWPNLYTTTLKSLYAENAVDNSVDIGSVGPLGVRFEFMMSDKVGVGLDGGYVNTWLEYDEKDISSDTIYNYKVSVPKVHALFKINFHFSQSDKLDAFAGFGVGYRNRQFKLETNDPNESFDFESIIPVGLRVNLGFRYYLTDNIGLGAEMGLGGPLLSFGVSAKF